MTQGRRRSRPPASRRIPPLVEPDAAPFRVKGGVGSFSSNLELVRCIYDPWGRGDFRSVGWADPEIEFVLADLGPDGGSWKGVPAMADAWRTYLGAWEDYRTEVDEYRELDDERVLVLLRLSGTRQGEWRPAAGNPDVPALHRRSGAGQVCGRSTGRAAAAGTRPAGRTASGCRHPQVQSAAAI